MEGQIFKDITTELDLNGPYLSFTTDPSDVTVSSGTATLSGLATCSYGISNPENIGTVTYQWYEFSSGTTPATYSGTKLTDGTGVSGATTKDLSLSNLVSGTDDQREFYLEAQYTPAQLDYESGNPPNEPLNSTKAGLTIAPTINMISQPTTKVVNTDTQTTFTVDASLSDGSGRALSYQWYVDGTAETNRTKTVTITTSTTVATPHSYAWTSDANHSLPSTAYDITTEIAAAGGGRGGRDAGGDGAPGKTGRAGRFTLEPSLAGSTLKYRIGSQGSGGGNCAGQCGGPGGQVTGSGDGTRGGGAGNRGWSGAGGGAGASSYIEGPSGYIIVAGGGGGGGGGSHNRSGIARTPGGTPGDAPGFSAYPGPVPLSSGQPTNDWENSGDGGGGGGGGGGSPGGNTGNRGHDKNHGAYTGYGGGSRYDNPRTNFVRQWGENGNGWANLSYMSTSLQVTTETRRTIISGVNTPTLSLKSDWVGSQSVYCKVSFTGASNTPASSDTVSFTVIPGTTSEMLKIENIDQVGVTASTIETNLLNGAYTIKPLNGGDYIDDIISIYPPDKDIEVYIDLYGASGQDYQYSDGNYSRGGKGGYGRLSMTLKQNQEYVIAGLSTNIGAPMLYEGGNLVAAVGQGGEAGRWGEGGDGGSFNTWQADSASGTGGGDGASLSIGNFSSNGIFGSTMIGAINATTATSYGDSIASGREGGRTIACTKGVYWRQQGKSPCSSLGTVKYRTSNGSQVTSTASITRGYKAGWNIMQTAGAGDKNLATSRGNYYGGDGGNGAFGGQGGTNNRGGGGGTGYISNSATSVSQSAGSNDDQAQVIIRLKT